MWDSFVTAFKWLLVVASLLPIIGGIGWVIWDVEIRPRLIPREEIERLADEIMRRYPDVPEEAAFIEEHAAWFRSHNYEQGMWRRVRIALRCRQMVSAMRDTIHHE